MRKIFKYKLRPTDVQSLELPVGAQVLCVERQHADLCLWAKVDPNQRATEPLWVYIVGTGHEMCEQANNARYLGTIQVAGGVSVYHIFISTKPHEGAPSCA